MSPSGRLCLFTILGLVLPPRGQTLEEATAIPTVDPTTVDPTTVDTYVLTPPPGETTQSKTEAPTETSRPTGMDKLLVTDPGTHRSTKEGSTAPSRRPTPGDDARPGPLTPRPQGSTAPSRRPTPGDDARPGPLTPRPQGSDEDDPFSYDDTTLRKRGLLVAAVLFITGIIILTSGKCRQLSKLCRSR